MRPRPAPFAEVRDWEVLHVWGYIVDAQGNVGSSEVLATMLGRDGIAAVVNAGGNFAATVRSPSLSVTAVIRDAIGTVPLYWQPGSWPVQAHADVRVILAATGLDRFNMSFVQEETESRLHADPAATHVAGLRRVLPGSVAFVGRDSHSDWQYFRPTWVPTQRISRAEAVDQMRDAIEHAVRDAVVGQRPASHISGGLDSSLVTALAQRDVHVGPTLTWSLWPVPPGQEPSDEQARLACAAEALGLDPVYCRISDERADWLSEVDPLVLPFWGYLTYEATTLPIARDAGATIILSGWGGDDFASAWINRTDVWLATGHLHEWVAHRSAHGPRSRLGRLRSLGLQTIGRYPWGHRFATRTGTAMDWRQPWPQQRTDHWWLAARHFDLEYRYPLLDPRVVRAAASMPPTYFANAGVSRWGFRVLAAEHLPDGVTQETSKTEMQRVGLLGSESDWGREAARAQRFRPELLPFLASRRKLMLAAIQT